MLMAPLPDTHCELLGGGAFLLASTRCGSNYLFVGPLYTPERFQLLLRRTYMANLLMHCGGKQVSRDAIENAHQLREN